MNNHEPEVTAADLEEAADVVAKGMFDMLGAMIKAAPTWMKVLWAVGLLVPFSLIGLLIFVVISVVS